MVRARTQVLAFRIIESFRSVESFRSILRLHSWTNEYEVRQWRRKCVTSEINVVGFSILRVRGLHGRAKLPCRNPDRTRGSSGSEFSTRNDSLLTNSKYIVYPKRSLVMQRCITRLLFIRYLRRDDYFIRYWILIWIVECIIGSLQKVFFIVKSTVSYIARSYVSFTALVLISPNRPGLLHFTA